MGLECLVRQDDMSILHVYFTWLACCTYPWAKAEEMPDGYTNTTEAMKCSNPIG